MKQTKNSFEEKLKKLEEITEKLESSEISLDELLKLYEEGIKLNIELKKILDEAELKINELKKEIDGKISINQIN